MRCRKSKIIMIVVFAWLFCVFTLFRFGLDDFLFLLLLHCMLANYRIPVVREIFSDARGF